VLVPVHFSYLMGRYSAVLFVSQRCMHVWTDTIYNCLVSGTEDGRQRYEKGE
jgi:hypothetical protein